MTTHRGVCHDNANLSRKSAYRLHCSKQSSIESRTVLLLRDCQACTGSAWLEHRDVAFAAVATCISPADQTRFPRAGAVFPDQGGAVRCPFPLLEVSNDAPRRRAEKSRAAGRERDALRSALQNAKGPAHHAIGQAAAQELHRRTAAVVQCIARRHVISGAPASVAR